VSGSPSRQACRVELERPDRDALDRRLGGPRPSEDGLHAGRQLAWRERLRHVVVRAELEPDDPVGFLDARGQQDHGQLGARPDPAAEVEPVRLAREHHVEQHETRLLELDHPSRAFAVLCRHDAMAVALEVARDDVADERLVVDHENSAHWHSLLSRGPGLPLRIP